MGTPPFGPSEPERQRRASRPSLALRLGPSTAHAGFQRSRRGGGGGGSSHGLTNCTTAAASTSATAPPTGRGSTSNSSTALQKAAASSGAKLKRCGRRSSLSFHQRSAKNASAK